MLMDCSGHQRRQWCSGRLHVRQQLQPQHFMPSRGRMGEPSPPPPLAGETQEASAKGPTTIQVPHIHIWLRSRPQGNMARVVGKGCHEPCPREQLHRHGSQSPPANRYLFSVVSLSSGKVNTQLASEHRIQNTICAMFAFHQVLPTLAAYDVAAWNVLDLYQNT